MERDLTLHAGIGFFVQSAITSGEAMVIEHGRDPRQNNAATPTERTIPPQKRE